MPRAIDVPRGMDELYTAVYDRVVGKRSYGISGRYSYSLVNFKRTDKPYDSDRINDN